MSIHKVWEKIKGWLEMEQFIHGLITFIVILVGLAGFGLGRLYEETPNPITIQYSDKSSKNILLDVDKQKNQTDAGKIAASKNGTRYYFSGCRGVGNIKEENKIYFQSEEEAISAGYSKASGCK